MGKCKWCGEARATRKSALARIALAFVDGMSDLESSKYEVAPTKRHGGGCVVVHTVTVTERASELGCTVDPVEMHS
jgi:hypothetical protein